MYGTLPNIVTINLFRNGLTGHIPAQIFNAPKLQSLNLSYNNLSGSIPTEISNATNLVNLILTINKINGTIPPSIGTLTKLKQIQLGTNLIEGNIPTSLGNLIQLDLLIMNDNKLTGSIPNEIGNLVNLRSFSIMRNLITGVIPVTLGNLTKLESLDLRNNQLSGTIPSELGNLTALTTLWLNSNRLTGSIPPTLGNLANLSSMYLDTNLLTGEIPHELGNLNKLTILYLNGNQLSGNLPPELGQLSLLRVCIMNNNKLTGTIPQSFKNLSKIETFAIHLNLFEGELPANLFETWTALTSLSVQNNKFSGSFPSLSNINKLTSLIANNNEFINFPAYLDHHLLLNTFYIHYNRLKSVPNLSNHPNKVNLRINYQYNFLLPGNLEALYTGLGTHAFKSLATLPQNLENKVMGLPSGSELNVSFSDYSSNNTVIWEKLIGTIWTDVSSQDQSASKNVFLIANANSSHTGKYRFKITNPKFTSPFIGGVTEIVLTDALPVGEPNALYNGLITSARWQTVKVYGSSDLSLSGRYVYTYDDKYQIKDASMTPISADLSSYQNTISNTYRVTGLDYDPNGNIKTLKRYNKEGLYQNNFAYSYKQETNQLASVNGYSNYTYNALGQLLLEDQANGEYQDKFIAYDVSGKVRQVYGKREPQQTQPNQGGIIPEPTTSLPIPNGYKILVENLYDDKGFRLAKLDYEKNLTTWYIRDASGTLIYTYEQKYGNDAVLTEIPVYGSGKIGVYYPQENGTIAYELTDHLGNVRAVIKKQVTEYIATMENTGVNDITNPRVQELQAFENIEETEVRDARFNHTPLANSERAAYLNWINGIAGKTAADKAVGPAISLKVDKLDTLKIETWVRYQRQDVFNNNLGLATLASILGGTYAYNGLFEGTLPNAVANEFSDALVGGGFFSDNDNTKPYAYLNYIIFDELMNPVASDWIRVTEEAAFWPGEEGLPTKKPVRLAFDEPIIVNTTGYIYIWVSNNSENSKVWFDDLTVRHSQQILSQATDYGVWGEVMREQKATPYEKFRFGYQGQFAEKDEETGWNHFELREYDPIIGRWLVPDPYDEFWSPYIGQSNDPINSIDMDGGCTYCSNAIYSLLNGDLPLYIAKAQGDTFLDDNVFIQDKRMSMFEKFLYDMSNRDKSGGLGFFLSGSGSYQDGLWHKGYQADVVYIVEMSDISLITYGGRGQPFGGRSTKRDGKTPIPNENRFDKKKKISDGISNLSDSNDAYDKIQNRSKVKEMRRVIDSLESLNIRLHGKAHYKRNVNYDTVSSKVFYQTEQGGHIYHIEKKFKQK
ncbi:MAG: leucine-rich repeat domain-containing protein [Chryseotalea sp.]